MPHSRKIKMVGVSKKANILDLYISLLYLCPGEVCQKGTRGEKRET